MAGAVPRPRHRRHHPKLGATHTRRVGLQHRLHRAQIQRPPPAPALAPVIPARLAVDTLFVDIDGVVLGEVDEDGAVRFGDEQVPGSIGVVDEITRRGWLSGACLLAVRRGDVPGGDLAAILRYAT